jgi:hypothetical protein
MAVVPKPLLIGLLAGLLLAVLGPQVWSHLQLPIQQEGLNRGSNTPLSKSGSMAQALRNIAKRGAGGYKSLWRAPNIASSPSLFPSASSSLPLSTAKQSSFSTTTSTMSNQKTFFEAVKDRRTYYQLNKEAPISDKQITDIAEKAVLHVPSSFNSQSTRLVVLLNKDHDTFWEFVLEVLKPLTPEEQFPKTEQKINGFKAAKGTVSAC